MRRTYLVLRLLAVVCAFFAGGYLVRFVVDGGLDRLLITALLVACSLLSRAVANHRSTIDEQRVEISALRVDLNRSLKRNRQYRNQFGSIIRHDAKFADMPRIGGKPLPVPEGHPEYRGATS